MKCKQSRRSSTISVAGTVSITHAKAQFQLSSLEYVAAIDAAACATTQPAASHHLLRAGAAAAAARADGRA